ncbi:MlaA family lipoprotein [Sphingomonas sp. CLY1604]|uniref:MlaA family lipoprotein n=1 Tax=Sphingomonas sp. CLY1604 TaxID=3457786 RepID=UPI003FD74F83
MLAIMLSLGQPSSVAPPPVFPLDQSATPASSDSPQSADAASGPPAVQPPLAPMPAPPATPDPVVPPPALPALPQADAGTQADILVTARADWEAPDPFADINGKSFEVTQAVDRALIGPLSSAYSKSLPKPVRDGIHNVLYNLREPVVFLNFLLQHKIGKALETAGRFVVNTTVGVIGLFDIARRKPFKLPRRSNGFANTLGFYGVPNGTFLYLPLVGPTTIRDLFGGAVDRLILPITLGQGVTDPRFAVPAGVLGALDHRAEFDQTYKAIDAAPGDPYANARDFYLQRRQAEIDGLHGRRKAGMGSGIGGMTEAPSAPIRLKQRGGAPTVELPVRAPERSPAPAPAADAPPRAPVPAH